jgi:hypothetical protein
MYDGPKTSASTTAVPIAVAAAATVRPLSAFRGRPVAFAGAGLGGDAVAMRRATIAASSDAARVAAR